MNTVNAPFSDADLKVVTHRFVADLVREAIDNRRAEHHVPDEEAMRFVEALERFAAWADTEANYAIGHAHVHNRPCQFRRDDELPQTKVS